MAKRQSGPPAPGARILIVDSYPIIREGLAMLITRQPGWTVCGSTGDSQEALRLAGSTRPDLAVVDSALKTGSAMELIKRIKARCNGVRLLVWSIHTESHYAERALRAGAAGYITKDQPTDKIAEAICGVLEGKVYLSEPLADVVLNRVVGKGNQLAGRSPLDDLSDRELEVFQFLGQGLDRHQIAARLRVSTKTVETYRTRVKDKLGLSTSSALLRQALQWWSDKA
jgi:DNA-binding NarL/FixJ family response regulator